MAVNTWDGAVSTDWNDAGNWNTTGVTDRVPTSADDVIIPDTSSINNPTLSATGGNPKNVNSLEIQANGTIVGGGIAIRAYGENSNGYAVDNDGIIDGGSTLHLIIKTDTTTKLDLNGTSGSFTNVEIDHASCVAQMYSDVSLLGNLTVTAGQLTTGVGGYGYSNLTVTGYTHVGTGSSAADTSTLTLNTSTCSFGTGKTDAEALWIKRGGTLVGGSGNWTAGSVVADNHAHCKFTLTSGTITVNGHSADSTRPILLGGTSTGTAAHGGGTIDITYASAYNLHNDSTTSLNNLTLTGNTTATMSGNITIGGNLTITSSTTLDTHSSNNRSLTVTGDITNSGTLTSNNSAISSRKLISTGTLSGGGGVYTVTGAGLGNTVRTVDLGGTVTGNVDVTLTGAGNNRTEDLQASGNIRHLTINNAAAVVHLGRNTTLGGDLLISAGTLSCDDSGTGVTFDVNGDVSVTGTLNGFDKAIEFGSLTIASGGTYSATSGTTTITSKTSDNYGIKGGGTFTHNNGEVKVTGNAFRFPIGVTYYDFTWDTSSEPCYLYSTTLSGGATIDGTQNAGYTAILGTLKINDRGFTPYNATKVFINNLIIGDTTDSANATTFDMQDSDVFDGDVIVNNILINADGQLKFGDNHAGKSDALEVRGAFRSLGGASGVVVV